jgi:hypothetical protein
MPSTHTKEKLLQVLDVMQKSPKTKKKTKYTQSVAVCIIIQF